MAIDPKAKALVAKIRKQTKDETSIMLGSEIKNQMIPRVTTGSLAFDIALGGGWAGNKWNEIVGDESSGKTALVLKTIAANQKLDPNHTTVWFAAEDFVIPYAEMLGVDMDQVLIVDDNTMEKVYQHAIDFLEARACDCIVIDSLPALVSVREEEGSMEDLQPGQAAFLTGKFFRKSAPAIKRSLMDEERVCVGLVINQWRSKIGVQYGDPRTTPGGHGKDFYYFIRAEIRRTEWITNTKDRKIGQEISLRNMKNKTAAPGAKGLVDYYFDGPRAGEFDTLKEIVGLSLDLGVVKRAGSWFRFGDDQWQGREGLIDAIRDDDELANVISKEVLARVHEPFDLSHDEPDDDDEPEPKPKKAPAKKAAAKKAPAATKASTAVKGKGWDPDLPYDAPQNVDHAVEQMQKQFADDEPETPPKKARTVVRKVK